MIEAVLFDLDGTLLDNDIHKFMPPYMQALSARLARLVPPARLERDLLASTEKMMTHTDEGKTNEAAFWEAFEAAIGIPRAVLQPITDDFYAHDFAALGEYAQRRPLARPLVEYVLSTGRKAVVATNPLFPRAAILWRLEWAGVADLPFSLITSYEVMHSAKPQPRYFAEIAAMIDTPAPQCLMVGDDRAMDAPSMDVGMRFFWIHAEQPFDATHGDLAHFDSLVRAGLLDD